jgi:hypothetical protein
LDDIKDAANDIWQSQQLHRYLNKLLFQMKFNQPQQLRHAPLIHFLMQQVVGISPPSSSAIVDPHCFAGEEITVSMLRGIRLTSLDIRDRDVLSSPNKQNASIKTTTKTSAPACLLVDIGIPFPRKINTCIRL